jgi:hypothetical protein
MFTAIKILIFVCSREKISRPAEQSALKVGRDILSRLEKNLVFYISNFG